MRLIEWVDSTTECTTAWHDRADMVAACEAMTDTDMLCRTLGFVIYENDRIIVITQSYHSGECGPCITIPVECIRRSHRVKEIE
jgi:hypothetical protein